MRPGDLDLIGYELGGHIAGLAKLARRIEESTPVGPGGLSEEHRALGYEVKAVEGSHDGVGNEYALVTLNGERILDGGDRVSLSHREWINGFVWGHARARR